MSGSGESKSAYTTLWVALQEEYEKKGRANQEALEKYEKGLKSIDFPAWLEILGYLDLQKMIAQNLGDAAAPYFTATGIDMISNHLKLIMALPQTPAESESIRKAAKEYVLALFPQEGGLSRNGRFNENVLLAYNGFKEACDNVFSKRSDPDINKTWDNICYYGQWVLTAALVLIAAAMIGGIAGALMAMNLQAQAAIAGIATHATVEQAAAPIAGAVLGLIGGFFVAPGLASADAEASRPSVRRRATEVAREAKAEKIFREHKPPQRK